VQGSAARPRRRWRVVLALAAIALAAGGLQHAGILPPALVERVYARGVFPRVRDGLDFVAGILPVSLAELALLALVLTILGALARALADVWRGRRGALDALAGLCARGIALASVLYLAFLVSWGLNHGRQPWAVNAGLDVRASEVAELRAACEERLARIDALRPGLQEDETGVFRARIDRAGLAAAVAQAFEDAARAEPLLAGPRTPLRFALLSRFLTAGGISGIYSPFTAEAHVNAEQPDAQLGFAALHEVAHARGFAREDEANFLAWRVGSAAREPELAYSAELMALRQLLDALARVDGAAGRELQARLHAGAQRDLAALGRFWQPRTRVTEQVRVVAHTVNDTYLKSQGQPLGTQSYGRMVDLLLATRRQSARPDAHARPDEAQVR
jgi:hypothetical protein